MQTGALNSRMRTAGNAAQERAAEADEDSYLLGTPLVRRFYGLKLDLASQQRDRAAERRASRGKGGPDNLPPQ